MARSSAQLEAWLEAQLEVWLEAQLEAQLETWLEVWLEAHLEAQLEAHSRGIVDVWNTVVSRGRRWVLASGRSLSTWSECGYNSGTQNSSDCWLHHRT